MQLKRTKHPFATLLVIGLALILAACNVKSDMPASSTMTDDEMVSLIWNLPYGSSVEMEHKIDKSLEENPNPTSEEKKVLMKRLLAEQVAKLSEDDLALLQKRLRAERERDEGQ